MVVIGDGGERMRCPELGEAAAIARGRRPAPAHADGVSKRRIGATRRDAKVIATVDHVLSARYGLVGPDGREAMTEAITHVLT